MLVEKENKKLSNYEGVLDVHEIVLLRWYDHNDNYIDIVGDVTEVIHRGAEGAPLCTVEVINKWKTGAWSGSIPIAMMANRFISPLPLKEEHINLFKEHKNKEYLFYIKEIDGETYRVYPFKSETIESEEEVK